ncbi:SAM-dependent methyltransferase [Alkaliphilus pronyensis]|uniref:SAM-dependent methyltransferase n=1 Tax=Alkaliphilus pronyensis TaxID=1482732 RepID=A0A6I0FJP3_9FIRM|nr:class I SAM-dependent methyltransferase [Alkaliphilus pronyensis]KAB3538628.1 SAM-dependent methyltransferase [Alkaliphilus pronyensis]
MKVKLTPRLKKITELIPKGSIVADIGTDHGYIPSYLIEKNIAKKVIASDVNKKPLENARSNIKGYGLDKHIETRQGSGLQVLKPHEVDTVIIAGMGGLLISQLLEDSSKIAKTIENLILQPMQAQYDLRQYLVNNGYTIVEDILVKEDNKIYEILKAKKGNQMVDDEIKYEIGFYIEKNPPILAEEFLNNKLKTLTEISQQLTGKTSKTAKEKYTYCIKRIEKIQEVKEWLKKQS